MEPRDFRTSEANRWIQLLYILFAGTLTYMKCLLQILIIRHFALTKCTLRYAVRLYHAEVRSSICEFSRQNKFASDKLPLT